MIQQLKNLITHQREAPWREEQEWKVSVNGEAWLHIPNRLAHPEQWATWGKIQARILSRFQEHWPHTHTYIRFHTYLPEHFKDILKPGQFETAVTTGKDYVFLFPDCQDEYVWETILGSAGLIPYARTIFILDQKPPNWQEIIADLFDIAQSPSSGHLQNESRLSICHCLCYSMDEDLVIARVDLPESTVLSILEDTARKEDLQLVLHRRT